MNKRIRNLKWVMGALTMLLVLTSVPIVHGGISWTGIDPVFNANGHRFNVWIEWPSQYTCTIEEIEVTVRVPSDVDYEFISESAEDLGCGFRTETETKVKFIDSGKNYVYVKGEVESDEDFLVRVKVYLDGELVRTYEGESDEDIKGEPIAVPQ